MKTTWKKTGAIFGVAALTASLFASCGGTGETSSGSSSQSSTSNSTVSSTSSASGASSASSSSTMGKLDTTINLGFLKGPSGLGSLKLMADDKAETTAVDYNFTLAGAPDEIVSKISTGELDIAALPSNVCATLYNKTEGGVTAIASSTLGVLSILQKGETITTFADLKGKTIFASGKGSTAQYALEYILKENGIDPATDVTIEYQTEHSETATKLASAEKGIALLPQPFVTTVTSQNPDVTVAFDLTKEWEKLTGKQMIMTTVIARTEFLEANKEAVDTFLSEYEASIAFTNSDIPAAAKLAEEYDVIKAAVAEKAIPGCNLVYLDGDKMSTDTDAFLKVMAEFEPKSVGGKVPDAAFYYKK